MDRWVGKVAIVTGASVGIGEKIAEKLVEAGLLVVGLARRKHLIEENSEKLKHLKGKLIAVQCDMSREEDILSAFKWTLENVGPVHILVNNAGILQRTNLIEGDTEKWRKLVDVNVLGVCIATREAVQIMRQNKIDGHIVNINSIVGHKVFYYPFLNLYSASKYALTSLTETLRKEFVHNSLKIKISSVSPGAVDTEIAKACNTEFPVGPESPFLESENVADAVLFVLSTPPSVQITELTIQPVGENI